jgi:DNA-binding response OmpR family regulator
MIATPPPIDLPFQAPVLPPPGPRPQRSIIVVEDEPSICRAVSIWLTRAGYQPVTATTGEVALNHIRTQYVDMMLIDLRIPDMRGDVVFHLATSLQPQLRRQTLFMTGDVTEQGEELILACDCPLLMKPFDLKDLAQAISNIASRIPAEAIDLPMERTAQR